MIMHVYVRLSCLFFMPFLAERKKMFRKKKKNYREIFTETFERLSDVEKKQVIKLAQKATELAEKYPNQPDPKKWEDMTDTIQAIEINNQIKSIVFRGQGGCSSCKADQEQLWGSK